MITEKRIGEVIGMHTLEKIKGTIAGNAIMESVYKAIKRIGISYFYDWTLKKKFEDACGYKLNLKTPKMFYEKINWIKVNCHDSRMTQCVDKIAVRDYVREKIGDGYLTKIYGIW